MIKRLKEANALPYSKLKQLAEKQLDYITNYSYWNDPDIDIDSLSADCSVLLTRLFTYEESLKLDTEKMGLGLVAKTDDRYQIRIYHFSFHSGGTRGDISHQVIQWQGNDGKLYSEVLPPEYGFYEIYPLKTSMNCNFYLLLGGEQASSISITSTFYVLQFIENELIRDYPAFVNRPIISMKNAEISFDSKTQKLSYSFQNLDENSFYTHYGLFSEKNEFNEKLLKKLKSYGNNAKTKFNGRKFIE